MRKKILHDALRFRFILALVRFARVSSGLGHFQTDDIFRIKKSRTERFQRVASATSRDEHSRAFRFLQLWNERSVVRQEMDQRRFCCCRCVRGEREEREKKRRLISSSSFDSKNKTYRFDCNRTLVSIRHFSLRFATWPPISSFWFPHRSTLYLMIIFT